MKKLSRNFLCGILIGIVFIFSVSLVQARQMAYFWKGVRPLGMGGAFTAIANDYNAIFYNPAGLERIPRWSFSIFNLLIEYGENGQDFYDDSDDTNFDNSSEVADMLRRHMGESQHVRAAVFPHFVKKNYGFGVLGQADINAEVNAGWPEVDTSAVIDIAGIGGAGFGFLKDKALRVGLSAKYVHREHLQQIYTADDFADPNFEDTIDNDLKEGSGIGFDLGAMYTFPVFLEPTVALVIQNIGGIDLDEAGEIPQQINLGVAAHYERGIYSINAGLDLMDITKKVNEDEDDFFRRVHLGVESWLWDRVALRAGLYQGYGSLGIGIDLWALKIDYANYAEEVGAHAGQRADRRHLLQLSFGW